MHIVIFVLISGLRKTLGGLPKLVACLKPTEINDPLVKPMQGITVVHGSM